MQLHDALARWEVALREHAQALESALPVTCEVWSQTLGEVLPYDGYTLGMECKANDTSLFLELLFREVNTEPVVEFAQVYWAERRHFNHLKSPVSEPTPLTPSLLAELDAFMPRFLAMLEREVRNHGPRRGLPPSMMLQSVPTESEVQQAAGTEPDYAVYPYLLRELLDGQEGAPILLFPTTTPGWFQLNPRGVSRALFEDLRLRNEVSLCHPPGLRWLDREIVLYSYTDDRTRFRLHPRSPGLFGFSRVGFSGDEALVFTSVMNPGASFWGLCCLTREGTGWRLVRKLAVEEMVAEQNPFELYQGLLLEELAESGYVVLESEWQDFTDGRVLLQTPQGSTVRVCTWRWLESQVVRMQDEPRVPLYYCGPGPTLVVSQLHTKLILEALNG